MSEEPGLGGLGTCMGSGLDSSGVQSLGLRSGTSDPHMVPGPKLFVFTWNELYLLKLSSHLPLCFVGQRDPARHGIYEVKPMGQEQPFCPPCGPICCVIRVAATQNQCLPRSREKCTPCLHHGSLSLLPQPGFPAPTYDCAEYLPSTTS